MNEQDRQIRAFGEDGQRAIQALRVAIIGLGGTGSVVARQLAHIEVRRFLLIDPRALDETNLNRVVGARRSEIGRPKVHIARRIIKQVGCRYRQRSVDRQKQICRSSTPVVPRIKIIIFGI